MFLTKKHLSRRSVLRGMGVTMALPLLDSMLPAQTPVPKAPTRLACIEMVHGSAGSTGEGTNKHYWSPEKVGRDFEMSQTLEPLAPFRDYLTIVSDTDLHPATAWAAAEEGADHFPVERGVSDSGASEDDRRVGLLCRHFDRPVVRAEIRTGDASSLDPTVYRDGGRLRRLRLWLRLRVRDTISWASPTEPLPMTLDPRMAFENLFGEGGTPEDRLSRGKVNTSILDWIASDVKRLQKDLGPSDRKPLERVSRRCARDRAAHSEDWKNIIPAARRGRCRRLR